MLGIFVELGAENFLDLLGSQFLFLLEDRRLLALSAALDKHLLVEDFFVDRGEVGLHSAQTVCFGAGGD